VSTNELQDSRSSAATEMLTSVAVLDEMVSILVSHFRLAMEILCGKRERGGGIGKSGRACLFMPKRYVFIFMHLLN